MHETPKPQATSTALGRDHRAISVDGKLLELLSAVAAHLPELPPPLKHQEKRDFLARQQVEGHRPHQLHGMVNVKGSADRQSIDHVDRL